MQFTIEVTWGERIGLALDRWAQASPGRNQTALLEAIGSLTHCTRNTMGKYLKATEPPAKEKEQERVVLLLRALGEDATEYGLDNAVVSEHLNDDVLRRTLVKHNAVWRMLDAA